MASNRTCGKNMRLSKSDSNVIMKNWSERKLNKNV